MAFKRAVLPIGRYIHLERDLGIIRSNIAGDAQGYRLSDHSLPKHDVILNISLLYRPSETVKCSDNRLYAVLEDSRHLGLGPSALSVVPIAALIKTPFGDPHLYSVSVDGAARAALGYKEVSLKSFNSHESESSGVAVESACKNLFSLILFHLLLFFFTSSLLSSVIFCIVTAAALLSAHRKTLLQNIAGVQMITHSASFPMLIRHTEKNTQNSCIFRRIARIKNAMTSPVVNFSRNPSMERPLFLPQ